MIRVSVEFPARRYYNRMRSKMEAGMIVNEKNTEGEKRVGEIYKPVNLTDIYALNS